MDLNRQWVRRVRNSSYIFIPILLKLYRCLDHALKMCIVCGFDIILRLIFDTFFAI